MKPGRSVTEILQARGMIAQTLPMTLGLAYQVLGAPVFGDLKCIEACRIVRMEIECRERMKLLRDYGGGMLGEVRYPRDDDTAVDLEELRRTLRYLTYEEMSVV